MKKYIVYFNIETVRQADEDLESLPVIKVIDDGTKKVIVGGIKEIEEIIVEILPYLGSDHSELMPIAVEVWDEREPRFSEAFRQRRRKEQNSSGNYFA